MYIITSLAGSLQFHWRDLVVTKLVHVPSLAIGVYSDETHIVTVDGFDIRVRTQDICICKKFEP